MKLDDELLKNFNKENYVKIFNLLMEAKTDKCTEQVKLLMGVDGLNYKTIQNNIDQISTSFCKRAKNGKYIFSPFREIEIPKAPFTKFEFEIAKKKGAIRTLSISTINDTIFQNILYSTIYDYIEENYYKKIDNNIFAYRKGKSVYSAINQIKGYINDGYTYGLDGDIRKFFDEINHDKLIKKVNQFFGNNSLISKYIFRFIKVKRVEQDNKKPVHYYYKHKPKTLKRDMGIPQGGVLSGLLANIYMYNFDKYITSNLSNKYDIKYVRYADDFLILCKTPDIVLDIYKKCKTYFKREKLFLHDIDTSGIDNSLPNENKTKAINLNKQHFIEFLGFKITPNYLSIKNNNIKKFKKIINHIIETSKSKKHCLATVIFRINAKILGNAIFNENLFGTCKKCNKPQRPQSWIGFFSKINDLRILKRLDNWIKKRLYSYYREMNKGKNLNKHYFKSIHFSSNDYFGYYHYNLQSLFQTIIKIKTRYKLNPKEEYCKCIKFEPKIEVDVS